MDGLQEGGGGQEVPDDQLSGAGFRRNIETERSLLLGLEAGRLKTQEGCGKEEAGSRLGQRALRNAG